MKEILKKHAVKSFVIRTIIVAVIIIVSLVVTRVGIFPLLFGGIPIDGSADFAQLKGKQVSFDAKYILSEYVRRTSTNTDTNSTTLTNVGYIVWDYDHDALFGIYLPSADRKQMDTMMDETWEWMYYEIEEVSSVKKIEGTIRELEGQERDYFQETIDELVEADAMDMVRFYTIDAGQVNGFDKIWLVIITLADVVFLIYFIWSLLLFATQSYYKGVAKLLRANPTLPESRLDADFASATVFENKIWIGRNWTFYIKGMKTYVMENRKQVWAYYFERTGRNPVSQIRFFDCNKKNTNIDITNKNYESMLKVYQDTQPQMILGYNKEWEKMYRKNFEDFKNLHYNQTISQMQTEDDYSYSSQMGQDGYFDDSRYNMDAYRAQQSQELYKLELTETGADKEQVIKVIRDMTGIGMEEATNLVTNTPSIIKENMTRQEAEEIKTLLESAGAKAALK